MTLIERLQALTGPDQKVDAEIAQTFGLDAEQQCCGQPRHVVTEMNMRTGEPISGHDECCYESIIVPIEPLPYTGSLDAAMTLVPEGWWFEVRERRSDALLYLRH